MCNATSGPRTPSFQNFATLGALPIWLQSTSICFVRSWELAAAAAVDAAVEAASKATSAASKAAMATTLTAAVEAPVAVAEAAVMAGVVVAVEKAEFRHLSIVEEKEDMRAFA